MSNFLILQHRLFVHLFNPVLQLLVLVHQQLCIVGGLRVAVVVDKLLQLVHLHLQLLIFNGAVLQLGLLLLDLFEVFLLLFLHFSELVALLLQHVREELYLLVLIGNDLC